MSLSIISYYEMMCAGSSCNAFPLLFMIPLGLIFVKLYRRAVLKPWHALLPPGVSLGGRSVLKLSLFFKWFTLYTFTVFIVSKAMSYYFLR
jgi:hypothetical protein